MRKQCANSNSHALFYPYFRVYSDCLMHIPTLFFSFPPFLRFLLARIIFLKNVTTAILSYVVLHLYEGTGNLLIQSAILQFLKNDLPLSVFDVQASVPRSSIQVLTQCEVAWFRWSPRTGYLSSTSEVGYCSTITTRREGSGRNYQISLWKPSRGHVSSALLPDIFNCYNHAPEEFFLS